MGILSLDDVTAIMAISHNQYIGTWNKQRIKIEIAVKSDQCSDSVIAWYARVLHSLADKRLIEVHLH
jgi:hypothetical protein